MFYLTPEVLDGLIKEIDESFRQFKPFKVSELCHLSALREALLLLRALDLNAMQKAGLINMDTLIYTQTAMEQ